MRKDRIFFWLLVFFLPTQLGRHFWPNFSFVSGVRVDFLAPTFYFTDLLVLALLVSYAPRLKINLRRLVRDWPALAVFGGLFLASLLAKIPPPSFLKLVKILEFFLLGAYIYQERPFSQIAKPLSLAIFCQSLIVWGQFFKGGSVSGPLWWLGERTFNLFSVNIAHGVIGGKVFLRPYGTFSHPNSLAGFFLVCLFLILKDKTLSTWWKTLVSVLAFTVLIVSFSQVAWLAAIFAFLFFLIKEKKVKKWLFSWFLSLSFLLATFGILALPSGFGSTELQERIALTRISLRIIKQNPFLGVGLSGFIPALIHFWEGKIFLFQPVHSLFLLAASEAGLFGFFSVLLFFIFLFKKSFKDPLLFSAVFVIFLTGLFDHYWFTLQQNELLLVLVSSLVWSDQKRV